MLKFKKKDFQIGWGVGIIIIVFLILAFRGYYQKLDLDQNARYTKGVITGTHKGAKGSIYIDFAYFVNGEKVNSWTPIFAGWKIGDSVLIKYNLSSPNECNIIDSIPKDAAIE